MSANIVTTLPLGPLDPERTELLLRVVEGLEPSTPAVALGFCRGRGARARRRTPWRVVAGRSGRGARCPRRTDRAADHRVRLPDGQRQAHRRATRARCRSGGSRRARLCRRQLPGQGPGQGTHAGAGRQHAGRRRSAGRRARPHRVPAVAARAEARAAGVSRCSRSAIRAIRSSARPAGRSTSGSPRSARGGSSTASTATSTTTPWPTRGSIASSPAPATRWAAVRSPRPSRACARLPSNRSSRASSRSRPK